MKITKIIKLFSIFFVTFLLSSCGSNNEIITNNNEIITNNTYADYCYFGIVGNIDGLKGSYITNLNEIMLNSYLSNDNNLSYAVVSSNIFKLYIGYGEEDSIIKLNIDIEGKLKINNIEYDNNKNLDLTFNQNNGKVCLEIDATEKVSIKVNLITTINKKINTLGSATLIILPLLNLIEQIDNNKFIINEQNNVEIKDVINAEKIENEYIYDGAATVSYIYKYGDKNINCYHQIKN